MLGLEEEILNKENIVSKDCKIEEGVSGVVVTVIYEVIENIGENQKIVTR